MLQAWLYERGQYWSHPFLSFLLIAVAEGTPLRVCLVFNCFPLHLASSVLCVGCHWHRQFSFQDLPILSFLYPCSLDPNPIFAKDLDFQIFLSHVTAPARASPVSLFCPNLIAPVPRRDRPARFRVSENSRRPSFRRGLYFKCFGKLFCVLLLFTSLHLCILSYGLVCMFLFLLIIVNSSFVKL